MDPRDILAASPLFAGIRPEAIPSLLSGLSARFVKHTGGDLIIEEGSPVTEFGILLSGRGRAVKWDPSGKMIIISLLHPGSEIGVILAASLYHKSPVSVQAEDDVSLVLFPFDRLLTRCETACPQHDTVLRNYIHIVAEKGLVLHERIDCLLRPTIREKILAYLTRIAQLQPGPLLTIPMDRNTMAEYLNVERSALSRELSHMKRDGILDYHKNTFRLYPGRS